MFCAVFKQQLDGFSVTSWLHSVCGWNAKHASNIELLKKPVHCKKIQQNTKPTEYTTKYNEYGEDYIMYVRV